MKIVCVCKKNVISVYRMGNSRHYKLYNELDYRMLSNSFYRSRTTLPNACNINLISTIRDYVHVDLKYE